MGLLVLGRVILVVVVRLFLKLWSTVLFFCAYERSLLVSILFSKAVIIEILPLLI